MSGTSSTPEREAQSQPVDLRIGEEIELELERFHARAARLREEIEASRIRAQEWEHPIEYYKRRIVEAERRTAEAERRIEEAECRYEEAERRIVEAERRIEEAQREIQVGFSEAVNTWRANVTGQAFANVPNQAIHERADAVSSPEDIQNMRITNDESTSVSGQPSMRESNNGRQDSGNPPPYDPNPLSRLESDFQHGSSLRSSSHSGTPGSSEALIRGLKGLSLQQTPPQPPPSSECSQPFPPQGPINP